MYTEHNEIKPPITLTLGDYERLSLLARAVARRMPDLVSVLTEELERAHVLADGHPEQTVAWGLQWSSATTALEKFRPSRWYILAMQTFRSAGFRS